MSTLLHAKPAVKSHQYGYLQFGRGVFVNVDVLRDVYFLFLVHSLPSYPAWNSARRLQLRFAVLSFE